MACWAAQAVVAAAQAVAASVDQGALTVFTARKCPEEGRGAAKRQKQLEDAKAALLEALEARATALLELHPEAAPPPPAAGDEGDAATASGVDAASQEEAAEAADPFEQAFRQGSCCLRHPGSGRSPGAAVVRRIVPFAPRLS
jgi:hypothetical protein